LKTKSVFEPGIVSHLCASLIGDHVSQISARLPWPNYPL
jgi:hypothetical protein